MNNVDIEHNEDIEEDRESDRVDGSMDYFKEKMKGETGMKWKKKG